MSATKDSMPYKHIYNSAMPKQAMPMQSDYSKQHWAWQQRVYKEMFAGSRQTNRMFDPLRSLA